MRSTQGRVIRCFAPQPSRMLGVLRCAVPAARKPRETVHGHPRNAFAAIARVAAPALGRDFLSACAAFS
jgi:hypothetical protein